MDAVDNVAKALSVYLERDHTPYAVMVDGPWGAGKTYFLREQFCTSHPEVDFVYVSLYGMDSIEWLRRRISEGWARQRACLPADGGDRCAHRQDSASSCSRIPFHSGCQAVRRRRRPIG